MKFSRIKEWVRQQCNHKGLKVEDVYLTNSNTGAGIEFLLKKLKRVREGREIYVLGASNSGKSTFVQTLIKKFLDTAQDVSPPTTSPIPGTTLSIVSIPIGKGAFLFDTPGIKNPNNLSNLLTPKEVKTVLPKRLKPVCYSMVPGQTLFFGGLVRIDFLEGKRSNIVVWISSAIELHPTKTKFADELFKKHFKQGKILLPPVPENEEIKGLESQTVFDMNGGGFQKACQDIAIPGLGWISVACKGPVKIKVFVPEGITPLARSPLVLLFLFPFLSRI